MAGPELKPNGVPAGKRYRNPRRPGQSAGGQPLRAPYASRPWQRERRQRHARGRGHAAPPACLGLRSHRPARRDRNRRRRRGRARRLDARIRCGRTRCPCRVRAPFSSLFLPSCLLTRQESRTKRRRPSLFEVRALKTARRGRPEVELRVHTASGLRTSRPRHDARTGTLGSDWPPSWHHERAMIYVA